MARWDIKHDFLLLPDEAAEYIRLCVRGVFGTRLHVFRHNHQFLYFITFKR